MPSCFTYYLINNTPNYDITCLVFLLLSMSFVGYNVFKEGRLNTLNRIHNSIILVVNISIYILGFYLLIIYVFQLELSFFIDNIGYLYAGRYIWISSIIGVIICIKGIHNNTLLYNTLFHISICSILGRGV